MYLDSINIYIHLVILVHAVVMVIKTNTCSLELNFLASGNSAVSFTVCTPLKYFLFMHICVLFKSLECDILYCLIQKMQKKILTDLEDETRFKIFYLISFLFMGKIVLCLCQNFALNYTQRLQFSTMKGNTS